MSTLNRRITLLEKWLWKGGCRDCAEAFDRLIDQIVGEVPRSMNNVVECGTCGRPAKLELSYIDAIVEMIDAGPSVGGQSIR